MLFASILLVFCALRSTLAGTKREYADIAQHESDSRRMRMILEDITGPDSAIENERACTDTTGNHCCKAALEKQIQDAIRLMRVPFSQQWKQDHAVEYQNYHVNPFTDYERHLGTGIMCRVKYGDLYHNFENFSVTLECSGTIIRQPCTRAIANNVFADTCAFCGPANTGASRGRSVSIPSVTETILYRLPIDPRTSTCYEMYP